METDRDRFSSKAVAFFNSMVIVIKLLMVVFKFVTLEGVFSSIILFDLLVSFYVD